MQARKARRAGLCVSAKICGLFNSSIGKPDLSVNQGPLCRCTLTTTWIETKLHHRNIEQTFKRILVLIQEVGT